MMSPTLRFAKGRSSRCIGRSLSFRLWGRKATTRSRAAVPTVGRGVLLGTEPVGPCSAVGVPPGGGGRLVSAPEAAGQDGGAVGPDAGDPPPVAVGQRLDARR